MGYGPPSAVSSSRSTAIGHPRDVWGLLVLLLGYITDLLIVGIGLLVDVLGLVL